MSDQESESASTPLQGSSRKIPRWLLFLLGIPLICGGLCGGLYWFVALRPQYVELDIPPMEEMYGWDYVERSVIEWDRGGTYYLWRQQTSCYFGECQNWDAIWNYFDNYLITDGWVKVDRAVCFSTPETQFLENGEGEFVAYKRKEIVNSATWCEGPTVCLAIWEPSEGHFEVVLSTENPSFWTEYGNCVD